MDKNPFRKSIFESSKKTPLENEQVLRDRGTYISPKGYFLRSIDLSNQSVTIENLRTNEKIKYSYDTLGIKNEDIKSVKSLPERFNILTNAFVKLIGEEEDYSKWKNVQK